MPERPPLLAEKLGFFGAVTASLSHELKNVLATINEYSGLLGDQLGAAEEGGRPLNPARLHTLCERFDRQVERGSILIQRLNRFAHSVDEVVAEVELGALLTEISDICDRFAGLRQVTLERRFEQRTASRRLELDPFALQQVIYLGIRATLDAAADQRHVALDLEATGPGCAVIIESADPLGAAGERLLADGLMQQLVGELGAALTREAADGADRVIISWP